MNNTLNNLNLKLKIDSYLYKHPGTLAKDIAISLKVNRKTVNSVIYAHRDCYQQDLNYKWYLSSYPQYVDKVLKKLNNVSNAKLFSEEEFEKLADWSNSIAHSGNTNVGKYTFSNGDFVSCDSKYEKKLLSYLDKNKLVIRCGGQALCIKYSSSFAKEKDYYPDIVALTRKHHIAIIEIKPSIAMSNHLNMDKYKALSNYCKEHGYEYMMIDPEDGYITYDELLDMPVLPELASVFENPKPNPKGYVYFENQTVDEWYEKYGAGFTKKEFKLQVHSLIIFYHWYNLYDKGFKVFNHPVKVNKNNGKVQN